MMSSLKKFLFSFTIFSCFVAMMTVTQIGGSVVALFWDVSIIASACMGLLSIKMRIEPKRLFVFFAFIISGFANYIFVGNAQISSQILICLYFFTALLFMDKAIDERLFLWILLLEVTLIIFKYLTVGFRGNVFATSSTNFVSVYLLYPAVVYYSLLEERKRIIPVYPAGIIWILSLLARGRGGIISTTFFLLGIFWISLYNSQRKRTMLLISILMIIAGYIAINLSDILIALNNSIIIEYFQVNGLRSVRSLIWAEYLDVVQDSLKNLLLGVRVQDTYYGVMFEGNFHNSFMNLHSLNGLLSLVIVVYFAVKNLFSSIKRQKYVFFICLLTILLRAFTDNVFWTTYGTPSVFFLLFYDTNKFKN